MKKGKKRDRNFIVGPMTPFVRTHVPDGAEDVGIFAAFENNRYSVMLKKTHSYGFAIKDDNGNSVPLEIMDMLIIRNDMKKSEIPWEEKQAIKNEIMGPMSDAVEIFPSEMRRVPNIRDYHAHLWVFPPGVPVPVGVFPKAMEQVMQESGIDDVAVDEDDLQVFFVEYDDVKQVFSDENDAKELYEKAGNEFSPGEVMHISKAPLEGDGGVWSDSAKAKIARIFEVSEVVDRENGDVGDSDAVVVNTNGPETDQDELEDEIGVVDESPNGDEEAVMAPEFMAMGVEQIKSDRRKSLAHAIENFENMIKVRKKQAEESKKTEEEDAAEEAAAAADLDAMRREILKK